MKTCAVIIFCLLGIHTVHAGTRYAIFIGKNNGGRGRPVLKYAHHDARHMRQTLIDVGNLRPDNATLLLEPDIKALRSGLDRFARSLAGGSGQREVFIYYSGHSDERGLLVDNTVYDFADLKKWVQALASDVKIVILDSCSSGSLARVKGGKKIPSSYLSESVGHRGTAILASSSSSEDSQESDQLKGSFFTHNLIAGIRGAADINRDKRVSLTEAYNYAYEETLSNTLDSTAGPQHPFFDFNVSGHGELAVSDIGDAGSGLTFADDIIGRVYVFDADSRLALKFTKTTAKPLTVRLNADALRIRVFHEKNVFDAQVNLGKNETKHIGKSDFSYLPVTGADQPKERYNSPYFVAGVLGPSFHFFMPKGALAGYDLADLGLTARVMGGIKFRGETALYLTGAVSGISNLTKANGHAPLILNAGIGGRYHFYPSGFFIGGSANAAWNRISIVENSATLIYNSGMGFGFELSAGMEWKAARDLGIGITWFSYFGAVYGGTASDPRVAADQIQNVAIGLMLSATFF